MSGSLSSWALLAPRQHGPGAESPPCCSPRRARSARAVASSLEGPLRRLAFLPGPRHEPTSGPHRRQEHRAGRAGPSGSRGVGRGGEPRRSLQQPGECHNALGRALAPPPAPLQGGVDAVSYPTAQVGGLCGAIRASLDLASLSLLRVAPIPAPAAAPGDGPAVPRAADGSETGTRGCSSCGRHRQPPALLGEGTVPWAPRPRARRRPHQFGHPAVAAQAQRPLSDAAAVNASRWALFVTAPGRPAPPPAVPHRRVWLAAHGGHGDQRRGRAAHGGPGAGGGPRAVGHQGRDLRGTLGGAGDGLVHRRDPCRPRARHPCPVVLPAPARGRV
jgi:hypothetical protein